MNELPSDLDKGIADFVKVLAANGVETFESCEGGEGHSYLGPTIRFHGPRAAGPHALSVAQHHAFPVSELQRVWPIIDGEPTGPYWSMTFYRKATDPLYPPEAKKGD